MNDSKESPKGTRWRRRFEGDRPNKPGAADVFETIKTYARQELLGPLQGAGRWIGMGLVGSLLLLIGGLFLLVAALRYLQEEAGSWVTGNLSWIPYLAVAALATVALALLLKMATKRSL